MDEVNWYMLGIRGEKVGYYLLFFSRKCYDMYGRFGNRVICGVFFRVCINECLFY